MKITLSLMWWVIIACAIAALAILIVCEFYGHDDRFVLTIIGGAIGAGLVSGWIEYNNLKKVGAPEGVCRSVHWLVFITIFLIAWRIGMGRWWP